jgi:uroporphyrin-III C-methyltransferase
LSDAANAPLSTDDQARAPRPASRGPWWPLLVALAVAAIALALAWESQRRVKLLERELVQRQEQSQRDAADARATARHAQDLAKDAAAKSALLEARVAEAAMQRSQVEELLQSVARSRDENVVADVEAAIRVALQQNAITGSGEPLVAALKQADERLARYNQPRLERVRRAVQRDLERTKAQGAVDISTLTARLDEAVRLVDDLPLLAVAASVASSAQAPKAAARAASGVAVAARGVASAPPAATAADESWRARAAAWWHTGTEQMSQELRSLVRVTRIDHPESALMAPEQQFFLRENLKLRLLNARLALFARQFDIAQADLRDAQSMLDRHFDRGAKRVAAAQEALRQVSAQARQGAAPRPDETLAALAAAAAGK